MKILHLSCMRELTKGQRKQLEFEYEASKVNSLDWEIVALHRGKILNRNFEKKIPKFFQLVFFRNLYAWLFMIKNKNKYDLIIIRHMTFDPFVLFFGWLIKNRISLHHAKEVEALKAVRTNWIGTCASYIERFTGYVALKQVKAAICVTSDICTYQEKRGNTRTFLYPNGIKLSNNMQLKDTRKLDEINILFMCGTFSPWHGLDLLIKSVKKYNNFLHKNNVKIHLVGKLLKKEKELISQYGLENIFILHGSLDEENYIKIIEKSDIGLDSLALFREGLKEGAALKVREYLAYGLPVYSAYKDTAIPLSFDFYCVGEVSVVDVVNFSKKMKNISREKVKLDSEKYISKELLLKKLYLTIKDL